LTTPLKAVKYIAGNKNYIHNFIMYVICLYLPL
jgi:hypothetical protein